MAGFCWPIQSWVHALLISIRYNFKGPVNENFGHFEPSARAVGLDESRKSGQHQSLSYCKKGTPCPAKAKLVGHPNNKSFMTLPIIYTTLAYSNIEDHYFSIEDKSFISGPVKSCLR